MALLMLVSSTGFSIDLHYCQGQIKGFSFFGEAASCHQQAEKKHCKKAKKACHAAPVDQMETISCKKDCCSNKTIKVEHNTDAKKIQTAELTPAQVEMLTAFVQVFLLENTDLTKRIIPHLNYVPPLLTKDIPVLIQSFLL